MTVITQTPVTLPQWIAKLQQLLGRELKTEASTIDPNKPLTQYGLDSIAALSIAGDLEDITGQELPPTLLWDYQTIEALASYLSEPIAVEA